MQVSSHITEVVGKVFDGGLPPRGEMLELLQVQPHSPAAGYIMASADAINRMASDQKAEIHAQIGVNLSPCPNNCSFCAFAMKNKVFTERTELSVEEVTDLSLRAESGGANALFLMATGDYSFAKFVDISTEVRRKLKPDTVMIANVGDFGEKEAAQLKRAGYRGIYHAVRMGEGVETKIAPETRLATVEAARAAGLLIGTCVEPIGPEHSLEEIVEKILIGKEMNPCYSGAMRRINIPGSELTKYGTISEYRMAFLVAVVRLAMGPHVVGNCTHEPNILGATAGANLFWAEAGTNPRDTEADTSKGRGLDIAACAEMFEEAEIELLAGPSRIYANNS